MKSNEAKTSTTKVSQNTSSTATFFLKKGERPSLFFGENTTKVPPFFESQTLQPKLKIGQANDRYEQQADAVADQVVTKLNTPCHQVQTRYDANEHEDKLQKKDGELAKPIEAIQPNPIFDNAEETVQREPDTGGVATKSFSDQLSATKGSGQSLPPDVNHAMGLAMGADFSNVRVHTGRTAANMSNHIRAQAFTYGNDVYFNEGKFNPSSPGGQHLLAHELTHTIQQGHLQPTGNNVPFIQKDDNDGTPSNNDHVQYNWGSDTYRSTPNNPANRHPPVVEAFPGSSTIEPSAAFTQREILLNESAVQLEQVIERVFPLLDPHIIRNVSDQQLDQFIEIASIVRNHPAYIRVGSEYRARLTRVSVAMQDNAMQRPYFIRLSQQQFQGAVENANRPQMSQNRGRGRRVSYTEMQIAIAGGPMPQFQQRRANGMFSSLMYAAALIAGRTSDEATRLSETLGAMLDGFMEAAGSLQNRASVQNTPAYSTTAEIAAPQGGTGSVRPRSGQTLPGIQPPPGINPHADTVPGHRPTLPGIQPPPGIEPHADTVPGHRTTLPGIQPPPGIDPHADTLAGRRSTIPGLPPAPARTNPDTNALQGTHVPVIPASPTPAPIPPHTRGTLLHLIEGHAQQYYDNMVSGVQGLNINVYFELASYESAYRQHGGHGQYPPAFISPDGAVHINSRSISLH